eukprot:COSAG01_NODE_30901_length_607_cov_1.933071_1_plen_201_part_11
MRARVELLCPRAVPSYGEKGEQRTALHRAVWELGVSRSSKRIDGWREHRCSKEGKSVGGRATTITALTAERDGSSGGDGLLLAVGPRLDVLRGHSIRRPDLAELAHRAVDQADVARELRVHLLLADRDALPFQVCGRPAGRVFQVVLRDAVRALRGAEGAVLGLGRRLVQKVVYFGSRVQKVVYFPSDNSDLLRSHFSVQS